jgi:CubicO group peptidase (beta-lactamase class C family)
MISYLRIYTTVICLGLSFTTVNVAAQHTTETLNSVVDTLYSSFNKGNRPGCSVVIIKDGRVVYMNSFGLANIENGVPVSDSTQFFLASVTKQFTGYGVAKLINQKRLNYNVPVSKYLPNENALWDSVKISNLIHHTSGIWDWPYLFIATGHSFNDVADRELIYNLIKSQNQYSFSIGSRYQYTSSNYMLLGEVVKNVVDTNYYNWMRKEVLEQAGMDKTVFQKRSTDIIKNRASGYLFKNNRYQRTTNNLSAVGTGFIYSNIKDMANWMLYLLNDDSDVTDQMFKIGQLNNGKDVPYAFGLIKRGKDTYWHDGYMQGFRTVTILNKRKNFAIVLLSNSGSNYIVRSAFTVANMYSNDTIPYKQIDNYRQKFITEPKRRARGEENTIYSEVVKDLEGIYLNTQLMIAYRIYIKEGTLFAATAADNMKLKPVKDNPYMFTTDRFMFGNIVFIRNNNGVVTGFSIKQRRNNEIDFKKIEDE